MKPEFLMKCAWYKYKTLLDKGAWEAPDEHQGCSKSNITDTAKSLVHRSKQNYSWFAKKLNKWSLYQNHVRSQVVVVL